jgi:tetratricopeptide (TPR) repeat protein
LAPKIIKEGEITKSMFIVAVMAIILLCLPTSGQTTAIDWYNKGTALYNQGRYNESIQAYDKAIEIIVFRTTSHNQILL